MKTPPDDPKLYLANDVFRRSLSRGHARLVQSTCKNCRSFVAASLRPELLDFIEKLHLCMQGQFPGKPIQSA